MVLATLLHVHSARRQKKMSVEIFIAAAVINAQMVVVVVGGQWNCSIPQHADAQ